MENKKIVFLYTELANYFLACVEELLKQSSIEIHIIRWKVNKEAPFDFSFSDRIKVYDRSDFSTEELFFLVNKINPHIIYVSGWIDKGYLKICRFFKLKIPVIVGFDNRWNGSFRQWIAKLISPFKIRNHFTHCWIPGEPQLKYAQKLGFKQEDILTGFYSCDFDFFHSLYIQFKGQKKIEYPQRFIYVGRYTDHKGILDLWSAFAQLQDETPNNWELWCLGTGEISPINHPKIKHFGFIQPGDMGAYIRETGVFILPSHFEPWGVVVHEFAAAGFPIICSDEVGARTAFVENNINGYIYKSGDINGLKSAMRNFIGTKKDQLFQMGENSAERSKSITPEIWSKQLMSLL
jgi:glycosyltransferase involved in cell wall biosynthesis